MVSTQEPSMKNMVEGDIYTEELTPEERIGTKVATQKPSSIKVEEKEATAISSHV